MKQPIYKSPVFWVGIISIFYIIAGNYGLYDLMGITEDKVKMVIDIVLGMFGVIAVGNNPSDKTSY
jgi:uncharacterized membrane protein